MSHDLTVRIAFLDVGQGDTIVVSTPTTGEAVVVDCIEPFSVIEYVRAQNIKHLRGLIISHLHRDHYKGVVQFLDNCEMELGIRCEKIIFNWPPSVNSKHRQWLLQDRDQHSEWGCDKKTSKRQRKTTYSRLKSWVDEHAGECYALDSNILLPVDGDINRAIEVLQPSHGQLGKLLEMGLNNTSGVLKINGRGSSALLTGDIEIDGWKELQKHYSSLHSDVLKFPHHGAWKNASVDDLLNSVQPSVVVISVGSAGDNYGHPNSHVFSTLSQRPNIRLLCTQATSQCGENVLDKRNAVIEQLKENGNVALSRRGCPCAGTIVVELGIEAQVIRPKAKFHQEAIIKPHFSTHKCKF